MSISKRKLAANRANGRKSHGPVTPEGKAKVSQNALKHGLCGKFRVLDGEDQDAFDYLFQQFAKDEQPVGSLETELVRRMAEYSWLRYRASRFQTACFRIEASTPELVENGKTRIAFSPELERFLNYQAHFDRQFSRASAELLKHKKQRYILNVGIVSQKRREAEDFRRSEWHGYRTERQKCAVMIDAERLEQLKLKTKVAKAATAGSTGGYERRQSEQIAA